MNDILIASFVEHNPQHLAHCLQGVPSQHFFEVLDKYEISLDVIVPYISPLYLANCFETIDIEIAMPHFRKLSEVQAAVVLRNINRKKSNQYLNKFDVINRKVLNELLIYNSEQVGFYLKKAKMILPCSASVKLALNKIDQLAGENSPIYIVNSNYEFKGVLNLIALIKNRNQDKKTIEIFVEPPIRVIRGQIPLEEVTQYPEWGLGLTLPVIGASGSFLGIISKNFLGDDYKLKRASNSPNTFVGEYINFSEVLWNSFHNFWGGFR